MFTGIIEDVGRIKRVERRGDGARLWVATNLDASAFTPGESIAVDGLCLTVAETARDSFRADVSSESLSRSTLSEAVPGAKVNIERAMRADSRFGGHIVQGHVDAVGRVKESRKMGDYLVLKVEAGPEILDFTVEKGSIAVNGVSLTVNEIEPDGFTVMLIPTTIAETNLPLKRPGDKVNLETDIIGKYVRKFVKARQNQGITMEKLAREGFLKK